MLLASEKMPKRIVAISYASSLLPNIRLSQPTIVLSLFATNEYTSFNVNPPKVSSLQYLPLIKL